ncbi:MAG: hypothetical protein R3236_11715 [Phycisphaeraceae bacterium]|nr:hypothetical protein [Phycisphaeraceae bacterium]
MAGYIVLGIVILIVLGIVAYYVARFMKGRLKLELSSNAADSGEPLSGKVAMEAKRPIRGLLKVSLVGREKQRTRSSSGNDSTKWVEVYRQDQVLEETREFPAGYTKTYAFEIVAPTSAEARRGGAILNKVGEKAGGAVEKVLKVAAGAANLIQGRIYWHVESRLDADGVDLYTKRRAHVNLRD